MMNEELETLNGSSPEQLIQQMGVIFQAVTEMKDSLNSLKSTIDLQQKDISLVKKQLRAIIKHQNIPFKEKSDSEGELISKDTPLGKKHSQEQINLYKQELSDPLSFELKKSSKSKISKSPPKDLNILRSNLKDNTQAGAPLLKSKSKELSTTSPNNSFTKSKLSDEEELDDSLMRLNVINEIDISSLVEMEPGKQWPKILNKNRISTSLIEETELIMEEYKQWLISPEELIFNRVIGRGSSASVYHGTYQSQDVAIKVLNFNPLDSSSLSKQQKELAEEINVMKSVDSDHVVHLHGIVVEPSICIVMEYCSKGSLHDVLASSEPMKWGAVFRIFKEIICGVSALHALKPPIVHRDLKSLNILLDDQLRAKVADFGLSRLSENQEHFSTLYKLRGTYSYCAPEVYHGEQFTDKADVYSLGIILWELVSKCVYEEYKRPYGEYTWMNYGFQVIIQSAKKGVRPSIPPCPAPIQQLIVCLWSFNPTVRPDCVKLLKAVEKLEEMYYERKDDWDSGALNSPELKDVQLSDNPKHALIKKDSFSKTKRSITKAIGFKKDKLPKDKKKKPNFPDLKNDEKLSKAFGNYLVKEMSSEYYDFWKEVGEFRFKPKSVLVTSAQEIFEKFLDNEPVTAGARQLRSIKEKISSGNVDETIFDEVSHEVESLLRTKFLAFADSYN